ncbi:MAG: tripartite tricarboxylate transporter TctB family protein, partial [Alphaproteobacteria bacterium]
RRRDLIAGSVLLLFAIGWTIAVWLTVPAGYGVGPRAFPLWLGVALAVLSALLVLQALRREAAPAEAGPVEEGEGEEGKAVTPGRRLLTVATVCAIIIGYGWLMPRLGFMPATALAVLVTLVGPLGERRPVLILGMSLGIALGAWLAFGKILGAYMPPGSWFSLF